MVYEYLSIGVENALTAEQLQDRLGVSHRDVTKAIERERRDGYPILASCDREHPGYYVAEDRESVTAYCGRLRHRAGEIFKTRQALLHHAEELPSRSEAAT